eukprot:Amastigsp_a180002_6.p5 type:complete len:119 gc:universal Amastigsp_a180002_6:829-473(-)
MRQVGFGRDLPLEVFDRDGLRQQFFVEIQQFDGQIVLCQGTAQQDATLITLAIRQREGRVFQQLDLTFNKVAFAGRTLAFLAAMRQRYALTEGGVQHSLAGVNFEFDPDGFQSNGEGF